MIIEEIRKELLGFSDEKYRDFQAKLIPTVEKDTIIGVRTPELRALAKNLVKRDDVEVFLSELPHKYFEENQLHAFIISEMKDYEQCLLKLDTFLPYVDNWATCDQMSPKIFKKYRDELLVYIKKWIKSEDTYSVRFAVKMLMEHFLEESYNISYPETVAAIRSEDYYVNMMIAWYFATALSKQYESVLLFIEEKRLPAWTHNKAIQKSIESYRISKEQKDFLRSLKVENVQG
ncbi:MAG: DNA alkylation repair protein [Lachnospiraceae bacterium]|nr:DNA alkylation repair protein [Lachnospiraceae bacterium]